jgi:hypothetical protein
VSKCVSGLRDTVNNLMKEKIYDVNKQFSLQQWYSKSGETHFDTVLNAVIINVILSVTLVPCEVVFIEAWLLVLCCTFLYTVNAVTLVYAGDNGTFILVFRV